MKPNPRVRLIQSWQTYSKGAFIWPPTTTRAWLIATGRAVLDEEAKPKDEPVAVAAPAPRTRKAKKVDR